MKPKSGKYYENFSSAQMGQRGSPDGLLLHDSWEAQLMRRSLRGSAAGGPENRAATVAA